MDDMDKGRHRLIRLENVDVLARVIPIGQSSVLWHGFALLNQVHAYTHWPEYRGRQEVNGSKETLYPTRSRGAAKTTALPTPGAVESLIAR